MQTEEMTTAIEEKEPIAVPEAETETKKATKSRAKKKVDPGETLEAEPVAEEPPVRMEEPVAKSEPPVQRKASDMRPGVFQPRADRDILTIGKTSRIEDTAAKERANARDELLNSYENKMVLTGIVQGVSVSFNRDEPIEHMTPSVKVKYGPYMVIIPVQDFTEHPPQAIYNTYLKNNPTIPFNIALRTHLEMRLGAEVEFIATSRPDEYSLTVEGNRAEAMLRQRVRFWFGVTTDKKPLINEGDRAEARIITASRHGIRIDVYGVETFIKNKELSWLRIQDASEKFRPGQTVLVVLSDIKRNVSDYSVSYQASVKRASEDVRAEKMRHYTPGDIFKGVINFIQVPKFDENAPNKRPIVFVELEEGIQCSCPFPLGPIAPRVGAAVYVRISQFKEEKLFLFGFIEQIFQQ